jgi:hypothetical protein
MLTPLLALSVGFSAPISKLPALSNSKLLTLRGGGGVPTDVLYNTVLGTCGLVACQSWLTPKATMEMYGVANMAPAETVFLRSLAGINAVAVVTMIAAKSDVDSAILSCWIAWILASAANLPGLESIGTPSGPVIATIGVFAAVAGLTAAGIISADVSGYILATLLIAVSALEIVSPQMIVDAFGLPDPSPLVKSLFENFSFSKVGIGMFLMVSKFTGKTGLGLASLAGVTAVNSIKTLARADSVGLAKPGLIVWSVLQSIIAAIAFINEK